MLTRIVIPVWVSFTNTSEVPFVSSRYVAFHSDASNLVAGDTGGYEDIFVHDTQAGVTTRVSTDSLGIEGNRTSKCPSISLDGRYVAFYSNASNLVTGDTNGAWDMFVKDTQTGATTRVNTDSLGTEANWPGQVNRSGRSISSDGRYVAFESAASNLVSEDRNGCSDVFVKDTQTGVTDAMSFRDPTTPPQGGGGGYSWRPSISSSGRYVAFHSHANNLVLNQA